MKKYTPWLIAAAVVAFVLYRTRGAGGGLPGLIAGGSVTPGPGASTLFDAALAARPAALDPIAKAKELAAAVKADPSVGAALGLPDAQIFSILSKPSDNAYGAQSGVGWIGDNLRKLGF